MTAIARLLLLLLLLLCSMASTAPHARTRSHGCAVVCAATSSVVGPDGRSVALAHVWHIGAHTNIQLQSNKRALAHVHHLMPSLCIAQQQHNHTNNKKNREEPSVIEKRIISFSSYIMHCVAYHHRNTTSHHAAATHFNSIFNFNSRALPLAETSAPVCGACRFFVVPRCNGGTDGRACACACAFYDLHSLAHHLHFLCGFARLVYY